jgi:tetratricopeptide (TPR) repeat protein
MIILVASLLTAFAIQPDSDAYRLNREGRNLLDQHRYTAAARAFRQAVDRAESELGPRDPATAMMLRNLALAYVHTGNSAAAEESAKLAYSILESRFGAAEPGLTPVLNVLAECYAASGRIAEAQRASEQAVSIGPSAGAHYGTALHNLGALLEYQGDLGGAASLYRRAIDVKIEILGAEHPYVALSKAALRRVERGEHVAAAPVKLELAGE